MNIGGLLSGQPSVIPQGTSANEPLPVERFSSFDAYCRDASKKMPFADKPATIITSANAVFGNIETVVTEIFQHGNTWYRLDTGNIDDNVINLSSVFLSGPDYVFLCFLSEPCVYKLPYVRKTLPELLNENQASIDCIENSYPPYDFLGKMIRDYPDSKELACSVAAILHTKRMFGDQLDFASALEAHKLCFSKFLSQ